MRRFYPLLTITPVLLFRKHPLLPQAHRLFAPVHEFSYTYRRGEVSVLHHVFDGAGRRTETGAEIRFFEELRQLIVLHGIRFQGGDGRYSVTEAILERNLRKGVSMLGNGPANDPAIFDREGADPYTGVRCFF